MIEDFVVNLARGQALHVPTGHLFYFIEKANIDAVTVSGGRGHPAFDPSLEDLREEATRAIREALLKDRVSGNIWR